MKLGSSQIFTDKMAISLSLACAIHCLVLPVVIVLLPSIAAWNIADEAVHLWILAAVIPTSIYALTLGCRKHKRYRLFALGIVGLSFLIAAVTVVEHMMGETGEKVFTSIGSAIIAFGHYWNFRLCQQRDACEC